MGATPPLLKVARDHISELQAEAARDRMLAALEAPSDEQEQQTADAGRDHGRIARLVRRGGTWARVAISHRPLLGHQ